MMSQGIVTVSYIIATILFILALGGLSNQETARRGNWYGIIGMTIALLATIIGVVERHYELLLVALLLGGTVGIILARRVQMTQMPELVAVLHSLVGAAAVAVGFASFMDPNKHFVGVELTIHNIEIYLGILIGAITFSGSVIAFGKLSGRIGGKPLTLPVRHWLNLGLLIGAIWFGREFVLQSAAGGGTEPLVIMTVIALLFGIHMVMAIGGADMPVVVSMLNSYSGWAASATGFMLGNDLLIVTGALVGSSGAILSYIMCRAMNRKFIAVIAGGFGTGGGTVVATGDDEDQGEVIPIDTQETAQLLADAKEVMIIPGYGMAVAQAQHTVYEITKNLRAKGINVRFGIHPVAGRMPGHMNVLLAEADISYDLLLDLDHSNPRFGQTDVVLIVGANDVVNPAAKTDPDSPIYGMPVLDVDEATTVIVIKRSLSPGFAGIDNPLFYEDGTLMYFGDAKQALEDALAALKRL